MADDIDRALDALDSDSAQRTVVGVSTIPPQAAQSARRNSTSGIPALTMHDPKPVEDAARMQRNSALVEGSPALQRGVQDPTWAAGAQDHFDAFDRLGKVLSNAQADFLAPITKAWTGLTEVAPRATRGSVFDRLQGGYSTLEALGGVALSPLEAITNPIARPLGEVVPLPSAAPRLLGHVMDPAAPIRQIIGGANPFEALSPGNLQPSPESAREFFNLAIGLAAGAKIGGKGARSPRGDAVGGVPHVAEGAPSLTSEGFVADVQGHPARFASPTAAEGFIRSHFPNALGGVTVEAVNGQVRVRRAEPVEPPGVNPLDNDAYTSQAEANLETVRAMQEVAAETPEPGTGADLIAQFVEGNAPDAKAWVPASAIRDLMDKGALPPSFGLRPNAYYSTLVRGGEFEVPLGTYLEHTAGKPYAEELNRVSRFSEEGVSVEEAKTLPKEVEEGVGEARTELPADLTPEEAARVGPTLASTRRAIARTFKQGFIKQLFTDAKALGVSDGAFTRYSMRLEDALNAATQRAVGRAFRALKKERKPAFANAKAQRAAEVEKELEATPAFAARHALLYGETLTGAPTFQFKLSRQVVEDHYGKATVDHLPPRMFKSGRVNEVDDQLALTPDEVAAEFGYSDGETLLNDLLALEEDRVASGAKDAREHVKRVVDEAATSRARQELGFDDSFQGLMRAAEDAATVPEVRDLLTMDLRALSEKAGLPLDTAAVEGEATRQFQSLPVAQASNPKTFERSMWKTGREAEAALLKGDVPVAFEARQQQLLNWHMLRMSHELNRVQGRNLRQYKRYADKRTRAGMAQPYMDRLHELLPQYGINVNRDGAELSEALGGVPLEEFVQSVQAENPNFRTPPTSTPAPYRRMQVGAWWDAMHFLNDLIKYGRESATLQTVMGRVAHDELVERAVTAVPYKVAAKPTRLTERKGFFEGMYSNLKGVDAAHVKIAEALNEIGLYDFDSVWSEVVGRPLARGAEMERRLRETTQRPVEQRFRLIPREVLRSYDRKLPNPFKLADGRPIEVVRGDIPGMALLLGTEKSARKLADGLGVTVPELETFINSHVTLQEARLVQAFWDGFAGIVGDVSNDLRILRGTGLVREAARVWKTPFGDFPGGYFPLKRDPNHSQLTYEELEAENAKAAELVNASPTDRLLRQVNPDDSFTNERTNARYVPKVDLADAYSAFDDHIRFLSYARTLASIRRFVGDPRVKQAISEQLGEEYFKQIDPLLNDTVTDWTVIADRGLGGINKVARQLRFNTSVFALAGNLGVMASQTFGAPTIMMELGGGKRAYNAPDAMLFTGVGIKKLHQALLKDGAWEAIFSKSRFMHDRVLNQEGTPVGAEFFERTRGLHTYAEWRKVFNNTVRTGYGFLSWSEFVFASGWGWLGAYHKAVEKLGYEEGKAVEYADDVVRRSQGSGEKFNLAAVQRTSGVEALFYLFNTFTSASHQYTRRLIGMTRQGRYGHAAAIAAGVMFLPSLMKAYMSNNGPKEKTAENMTAWLSMDMLLSRLTPLYYVGNAASTVGWNITVENGGYKVRSAKDWEFGNLPGFDQIKKTIDLILVGQRNKGSEFEEGALKNKRPVATVVNAAGAWAPIPGGRQIANSAQYLADVQDGKIEPDGFWDFLAGLVEGRRPPRPTSDTY